MCGIVGYIGEQDVCEILLEGLKKLEYRGYDSAGVAIFDGEKIELRREVGKLRNLINETVKNPVEGKIGIGHTRWATHGRPTEYNTHPHTDCTKKIVVVHNGIIENYMEIKSTLEDAGHVFCSDTDTEVVAHLIESHYKGNIEQAVKKALDIMEGSYAIAVLCSDELDKLVAARRNSPLILGIGEGENFIASDVPAILNYTRNIIYLGDNELAVVKKDKIEVYDKDFILIKKPVTRIDWNIVAAEKGGYDHFMLKEINEQPTAYAQTISGRVSEVTGKFYLEEIGLTEEDIKGIERICLVACGTAYHAALVGEYYFEKFARIPTKVELASEFRYKNPVIDSKTLVIGVSQSGETADTLAAIKEANALGAKTIGVINAKGSLITRETLGTFYIHAGPEIGVASTKAYTAMLGALNLLALYFGQVREKCETDFIKKYIKEMKHIPQLIQEILADTTFIQNLAFTIIPHRSCLYLGRGYNYPTALEGALKLKELSYIHAEGYAAGEMKHGPIALIEDHLPVIVIATQSATYDKVISNIKEVTARDALPILVGTRGDKNLTDLSRHIIYVPPCSEALSPVINAIPLQLLSYYVALKRGCDVDQPRNLAKSVTVE